MSLASASRRLGGPWPGTACGRTLERVDRLRDRIEAFEAEERAAAERTSLKPSGLFAPYGMSMGS